MPVTTHQVEKIRDYGRKLQSLVEIMDDLCAWRDRHCTASYCAVRNDPGASCRRVVKVYDSRIRSVARDRYVVTAERWLNAKDWLIDESGKTFEGVDLSKDRTARTEIYEMQVYMSEEFLNGTVELLKCGENADLGKEILEKWKP